MIKIFNKLMEKKVLEKSRGITMAKNWKKKEIQHILTLRDQMIQNNIDNKNVEIFLNQEYEKINKEYEERIKKYNQKNEDNIIKRELNKKREKAINFLIKNKNFLEEKGVKQEIINNYVEKQYETINKTYKYTKDACLNDENINLDSINFID